MMMTFVNMDAPGITILPTHRVVFGLPGFSPEAFLTAAEDYFDILPIAAPEPTLLTESQAGSLHRRHRPRQPPAHRQARNHRLHPQAAPTRTSPRARPPSTSSSSTASSSSTSSTSPTSPSPTPKTSATSASAEEAVQQVHQGKADIAFLIRPVTLQQLNDISLSGDVMPQKSTDFYPKLLSGLAIYALD